MAKEPQNLRVLREFRIRGEAQEVGSVISKEKFKVGGEPNAADWRNLLHMTPARVEETDDAVTEKSDKPAKSDKNAMPGATR